MRRKLIVISCLVAWLVAAVGGWVWLARFSATPGEQAHAPIALPSQLAQLALGGGGEPLLFVALHPQCSCSRATMRTLARTLQQAEANPSALRPRVVLLMFQPRVLPAHWSPGSPLPALAASLHPAIVQDVAGAFAAQLHASTSGEVLLYSAKQRLLFQGGITALRGHEGPSVGADTLSSVLANGIASRMMTNVFGCALFAHAAEVTQ